MRTLLIECKNNNIKSLNNDRKKYWFLWCRGEKDEKIKNSSCQDICKEEMLYVVEKDVQKSERAKSN